MSVVAEVMECLVNLLNGWSRGSTTTRSCTTSSREATGHALWHTTWYTTGTLVQLGDDWVAHLLQLLLLMLILIPLGSLQNKDILVFRQIHDIANKLK